MGPCLSRHKGIVDLIDPAVYLAGRAVIDRELIHLDDVAPEAQSRVSRRLWVSKPTRDLDYPGHAVASRRMSRSA